MLAALILIPLALLPFALFLPWYRVRSWLLPLAGAVHLLLVVLALGTVADAAPGEWVGLDPLARLVLLVSSPLFLACALYAVDYLEMRRDRGNQVMVPCLLVFLSALSLAAMSRHLGLLWLALESTTLASAPLIYYNRNRHSIEATWKYLLICSVGIALAMLGLLFVAYAALRGGAPVSLLLDDLLAAGPLLSRPWLHAGFAFLLVGFGTKMGLAPLHAWKPDAYGEAPGLVGALLAGALTSLAFLAVLRSLQVMAAAGSLPLAREALLGLGLFSLLLAALFMMRQTDLKRMLAYSSIEHMGLLAVGVGIGGLATFGALLHLVNNALAKGCLFLSAGNIHRAFASKRLSEVRGALTALPFSGTLFLCAFLAVTGSPPFGMFLSEFTILRGIFAADRPWVGLAVVTLLATVFVGMAASVLDVSQGEPAGRDHSFTDRFLLVAPPLVLLLAVLLLGLYLPEPLRLLLEQATAQIEGAMSPLRAAIPLANGAVVALADLPLLGRGHFTGALLAELNEGARVAAYFAVPAGSDLELFAVLARDACGELAVLRTAIATEFPSLAMRCPELQLFEREIAEQYGSVPSGHPWFKPVRFHPSWRAGRDAWGRIGTRPQPAVQEFYRVAGEEVHEVAVGPVHAGVIEPGHFRFQCHGELVMHLEIALGYQHRDIERLLLGGPHPATPWQIETLAGDTSIGHATAWAHLLEALGGAGVPPRGAALRLVALELERLANHVGDIGALANDVGYLPTAAFCGRLRGDYLNATAALCGNRFGRGLVRPGGVTLDLDATQAAALRERLLPVARDTRGALELFFETPSVLARLEGAGKVAVEDAAAVGLVGVAARACGLERDARRHHPLGAYREAGVEPAVKWGGDVYARAAVRRQEIDVSLALIDRALAALPDGPVREPARMLRPNTLAVSLVEGWRGEIVHAALTDADGRMARYKVVDPSFRNWTGLALALRGEQISDFPLCNKSFNLSYCGFDL